MAWPDMLPNSITSCLFQKQSNGLWKCAQCQYEHPKPLKELPFRPHCPNSPDLQPAAERLGISLADMGHYAHALARWTAAGFPTRDQAEVERIEAICVACEHYRNGRCKKCGCCVNKSRMAVLNKIKMATESCPVGKW